MSATTTLDCSGMNCPLPILRLNKAVIALGAGESLEMIATDPGSMKDVDSWAKQTGHSLVSAREENGRYVFSIRKAG